VIDQLVVIGVGLIGGSFAAALREAGAVRTVVGVGRTRANLDDARNAGLADRVFTLDERWTDVLADADVVLLAAPVAQYPDLFARLAPSLGARSVVTDAGSTKQDVVAAARASLGDALPRFVPGHPVAGSEASGARAADARLFRDREVILTPLPETSDAARDRVAALWQATGARVTTLTPAAHDRLLATVSHLPHLVAFALVDLIARRPDADGVLAHAGSGLRDTTRIAASSPELWRDIALANRAALGGELDALRGVLDEIATALDRADGVALAALFERAARVRRAWSAAAGYPRAGEDDA
jgi:prephenate dehydrogenase